MGTEEEPGVREGDTFAFRDRDDDRNVVEIPATARQVVSDGTTTVAVWVADADWATACEPDAGAGSAPLGGGAFRPQGVRHAGDGGRGGDQVSATGCRQRHLRLGHGDLRRPVGAARQPVSDSYAEASGEIHILLFDISGDGVPEPGEPRIVGFFWAKDNFLHDPEDPLRLTLK